MSNNPLGDEIWDVLIIGAGPAGLSAAINAKARNMRTLLLDLRELVGRVRSYPEVSNYLGFHSASGAKLANEFARHFCKTGYVFKKERVLKVTDLGDYFMASTHHRVYQAVTVIFCAGVSHQDTLPGEEQFLGRGVSYCVTCDGALFRGKDVLVLGYDNSAEEEANSLSEFAREVTYIAAYEQVRSLRKHVRLVRAQPVSIAGDARAKGLVTDAGEFLADGIFIIRQGVPVTTMFDGLETEEHCVRVARDMSTNIPGVFAAGDCTGPPYQIAKAVGEGQVAALNAASYVSARKRSDYHADDQR